MIIDAFLQLIINSVQQNIAYVILAVISISALVAAFFVFESSALKILAFISGKDFGRPPIGYQYEVMNSKGKFVYRTWTRKDQYYYDQARRRR